MGNLPTRGYGLTAAQADILTRSPALADYFETACGDMTEHARLHAALDRGAITQRDYDAYLLQGVVPMETGEGPRA